MKTSLDTHTNQAIVTLCNLLSCVMILHLPVAPRGSTNDQTLADKAVAVGGFWDRQTRSSSTGYASENCAHTSLANCTGSHWDQLRDSVQALHTLLSRKADLSDNKNTNCSTDVKRYPERL